MPNRWLARLHCAKGTQEAAPHAPFTPGDRHGSA
jgi:hypothetical protein